MYVLSVIVYGKEPSLHSVPSPLTSQPTLQVTKQVDLPATIATPASGSLAGTERLDYVNSVPLIFAIIQVKALKVVFDFVEKLQTERDESKGNLVPPGVGSYMRPWVAARAKPCQGGLRDAGVHALSGKFTEKQ